MKITIIGAGLTGCVLARLLKDRGHKIEILEKTDRIAGLCATGKYKGIMLQLFGPHNFNTTDERVRKFVLRFAEFNDYKHYKGTYIDGKIVPYPISYETIELLPEREKILEELASRPEELDTTNFETCVISMMGSTLYEKFIKNYTRKLWGVEPKYLSAEWASQKIEIREDNSLSYFKDAWQGQPINGYINMFKNMTYDIPITYRCEIKDYRTIEADLIISTMAIDKLFGYRYGRLKFRAIKFMFAFDEDWENDHFGDINYPNDCPYIRKTNYNLSYKHYKAPFNIIGYEFPGEEGTETYPVFTSDNKKRVAKYVRLLIKQKNLVSAGRLGLFKYCSMNEAIIWCLDNIDNIENFSSLDENRKKDIFA